MAWPSDHGLAFDRNGLRVRPRRLWWHVSNVPLCRLFWDLTVFDALTFGTLKTCRHNLQGWLRAGVGGDQVHEAPAAEGYAPGRRSVDTPTRATVETASSNSSASSFRLTRR